MNKARRKYTREFKLEAVRLLETSGKSAAQIERELGIGIATTRHWTIPARRSMSNSSANRSRALLNTLSTKPGEVQYVSRCPDPTNKAADHPPGSLQYRVQIQTSLAGKTRMEYLHSWLPQL